MADVDGDMKEQRVVRVKAGLEPYPRPECRALAEWYERKLPLATALFTQEVTAW
jgi:hypothetical protein